MSTTPNEPPKVHPYVESVLNFLGLSTTMTDPRRIAISPFPESSEARLDTSPPTIPAAAKNYMRCTKRAMNTRIIGFSDPNLQFCFETFFLELRASRYGGNKAALDEVLSRRRNDIDVYSLPWDPSPMYLQKLEHESRLSSKSIAESETESTSTTTTTSSSH